jgi:hypothetical protein
MSMSTRSIRLTAVASGVAFLAVAFAIRAFGGGPMFSSAPLEQYSGSALYASTMYAFVVFVWPRVAAPLAGIVALGVCWALELAQLTGVPAALSARSIVARLLFGATFDWVDMLWYPVGIVPIVAVHWFLRARTIPAPALASAD